jgi:multiple sugar transport system substrate-binding protein
VTARLTRSDLLRRAGVAAAAAAVGGGTAPYAFAGPHRYRGRELKGDLSIVQWNHVVPAYDVWFDETWATAWGEANDAQVSVDHIDYTRLPALARSESTAQKGHDIFGFLSPPAAYEDQVIDHADIVTAVERKVGPYSDLGRQSTYNPRTSKYFGISDNYVPAPAIWRHDLWNSVGESPATWDHVRAAAPKLKSLGHPIGIGQSNEVDSNTALIAFMMCFGSFLQDESNALAIDGPNTVEAVRFMSDLYRAGEEDRIFGWNQASNNQYLLSGRGSLILNAISATRTADELGLPFASDLWLWPVPAGPHARLGLAQATGVYAIWKFAKNRSAAEKFLADLCIDYRQATVASSLFNYPSFPGAFPTKDLYATAAADPHPPRGKYTILTTTAARYTHNIGYPGTSNAAVDEVLARSLIPQMFAQVSQGKASPTDAVRSTTGELRRIWAKWKAAGRL